MTLLHTLLASRIEGRLREKEQDFKQRLRGQSPEAGFEAGVRAALAALGDVFTAPTERRELEEALAMEGTRIANAGPHPRSRLYRSEPLGWEITDTTPAQVHADMSALAKRSRAPAVVFDLDGTLFDVSHRTLGILREWLRSPEPRRFPGALVRRVEAIELCHIGYSLPQAFENAGLDIRNEDAAGLLHVAEKFWRRRFFDGKTLVEFDVPVPGSAAFVQSLAAEGVRICYLTGRDHRGMSAGTRRQLEMHGFPTDPEHTALLLKQNHEDEDHAFKQSAFAAIAERNTIVGNFENEYINIGHMAPHAPEACHVILDTQHSGRPVAGPPVRVKRISDFVL